MEGNEDFIIHTPESCGGAQARTRERERCCIYPAARHEGQKPRGQGACRHPVLPCLCFQSLPRTGTICAPWHWGWDSVTGAARMECPISACGGVMLAAPRHSPLLPTCPVPDSNWLECISQLGSPNETLHTALVHSHDR